MIGTPSATTTHTITYVPGTFSNQYSYYAGELQQVGNWLNARDPNLVVFVWHGGEFPGEAPGTGIVQGLVAANQAPLALSTGRELAGFGREIQTDPRLASAQHDAIAHSWGLAATSGSEMADAHYDRVFSLSGAWMPPGWEQQSGTTYSHYTYADFLTVAKDMGMVGDGNVPDTSGAFQKPLGDPIPTDGDWTLVLPSTAAPGSFSSSPPIQIPMNTDLSGAHSLVASSKNGNLDVLRDIQKALGQ